MLNPFDAYAFQTECEALLRDAERGEAWEGRVRRGELALSDMDLRSLRKLRRDMLSP